MGKKDKPLPETCPNGHTANSNGECFDPNCVYNVHRRHEGHGR